MANLLYLLYYHATSKKEICSRYLFYAIHKNPLFSAKTDFTLSEFHDQTDIESILFYGGQGALIFLRFLQQS